MIKFLIEKEFKQLFRNSFLPKLIFIFPCMIMILMPWAANLEIKNINLNIVDNDHSVLSRRLVDKIGASTYFCLTALPDTYDEALLAIEAGSADVVLEIPRDFEKDWVKGEAPRLLVAANAVNGTKGSLGGSYLSSIISDYTRELGSESSSQGLAGKPLPRVDITTQNLYNPTLNYKLFMIGDLAVLRLIGLSFYGVRCVLLIPCGVVRRVNLAVIALWLDVLVSMIHTEINAARMLQRELAPRDAAAADLHVLIARNVGRVFTERRKAHIGHQRARRGLTGDRAGRAVIALGDRADHIIGKRAALIERFCEKRSAEAAELCRCRRDRCRPGGGRFADWGRSGGSRRRSGMQESAGALLRLDSPLCNGGFGKAIADGEKLFVGLRSMLPGLRFHLPEGGGLRILLGVLCLFALRDAGLFRVETSHCIMLCMTAFLRLHLALGNTDLLLLQGGLHDLRLLRSGFLAACFKFIRLHHGADKLTLF